MGGGSQRWLPEGGWVQSRVEVGWISVDEAQGSYGAVIAQQGTVPALGAA